MQITIHREIDQIGGCITEIATATTRIMIDLGENLINSGQAEDRSATKEAIATFTQGVDALLYTHYNSDHSILADLLPREIPQYIGGVAQKISICKNRTLGTAEAGEQLAAIEAMHPMKASESFMIGDISITPYFVSYSSYESFMFVIEADGKRILHTGNFRDHGYLCKGLETMLSKFIKQVDILLTEGSTLSRGDEAVRHESELQREFGVAMRKYKNCFIINSPTDLERLSSIRQTHIKVKSRTPFVADNFQQQVLSIFTESLLDNKNFKIFNFKKVYEYSEENTELAEWIRKDGFTMLINGSQRCSEWLDTLLPDLDQEQTCVVFSMCGELINPESDKANSEYLNIVSKFKNVQKLHTGYNASKEALTMVCERVNPRLAIVPIHSDDSESLKQLLISDELLGRVITTSQEVEDVTITIA